MREAKLTRRRGKVLALFSAFTVALSVMAVLAEVRPAIAASARANDSFEVESLPDEPCRGPSGGIVQFVDFGPGAPGNGEGNDDYVKLLDLCHDGHGVKAWIWRNGVLIDEQYNGRGAGKTVTFDPFGNVAPGETVGLRICNVDGNGDRRPNGCQDEQHTSRDG
jgi:hypothetical protein